MFTSVTDSFCVGPSALSELKSRLGSIAKD